MISIYDIIKSRNLTCSRECEIPAGIVLKSKFTEGKEGVISIVKHEGANLSIDTNQQYFIRFNGKMWVGGFENPNYPNKEIEPFNRSNRSTYISSSFHHLEQIVTSDGGRFFSSKKSYPASNLTGNFNIDEEVGMQFNEGAVDEFSQYLREILPKMGVPKIDVTKRVKNIIKRLDINTYKGLIPELEEVVSQLHIGDRIAIDHPSSFFISRTNGYVRSINPSNLTLSQTNGLIDTSLGFNVQYKDIKEIRVVDPNEK